MAIGETLADIYRKMEDKWYGFVDWLDEKGLSLYPVIDAIEERNIPSFPVAVAIVVLLVVGIFFALTMLVSPQATVNVTVFDEETGIPLEGAIVKAILASGEEITGETDEEGFASLVVPAGDITLEIEKPDYKKFVDSLTAAGLVERSIELEKGVHMLSRVIQLMKTGTSQLLAEDATIRFTCSDPEASDFDVTKTSVAGEIQLDVPSNCGSIIATPLAGFTTTNGVIGIDNTAPQLFLQPVVTNVGTVHVAVEDEAGQALAGITVMVNRNDGVLAGTQYTSAAGTAVLDGIPTGTYYIVVHDSQGRYADFDSSLLGPTGLKELVKDGTIYFDVVLSEAVVGNINVILKDSVSRDPVENATVYLKKNGTVVDTEYSNAEGIARFNVGENVAYELEIDSDNHLIAVVKSVRAAESFYEVFLEPATADNTQVLKVEVVDTRQNPIDGVRLVLKKADGTIYANNVVTGGDGMGEFTNLPLDTYYVYAVKKGFEGKNSDPITIKARQINKITIVLPIGFGDIEVLVLNDELQPVQGAVVEAYNSVTDGKEQEEITNLDGKAAFNFRADKKVYFKIDAEDFLPFYSIAGMPDADSTVTREVVLAKDPGQLQVKLLGLYLDGEQAPEELAPGTKYTAKLLLLIPRNAHFDEGGLHLRVGNADEGKTNIMEEDSLYLKDISASTASILRGTSFTPPRGYAIDSTHLTTGDSKWANITWNNVSQGAYAVEAEVQVNEAAQLGQILYVSYRGWGKSGSYTRFPADAELGGADSTSEKQALYANARQRAYTAGPSGLCGANFCKTYSVEDVARGLKVNVTNQYGATIGSTYRLNFLISSTAEQAFTNSEIEFGSKGDGLRFGSYAITDASGLRSEGAVNGYLLSKGIGDMRKESSVFGFIEFKTEKEGSNILTIVLKSNNQPILSEMIDVRVEPAEQLQLDIIPKEIIPGIDNEAIVRVTDESEEPVSNAIVTVKLDKTLIVATESNGQGEVEFKLEAPATGSTLYVTAEKTGYKKAELEMDIDEEILTVTPPEINQKLNIAINEIEQQLWFSNQTITDFVISKLRFSSTFDDLVEFEWDDDYIGRELKGDADLNVFLLMKLTGKGALVKKPVKLEGSLSVYLFSPELQRTFVENVPVIVRIGLGNDVDDEKCLSIMPVKWEIITSSDEMVVEEFLVKNSCTIDGEPMPLSGFEAKVDLGKFNSLGRFTVTSGELPGANTVMIGEEYATISDVLPADFEGTITIEFTPNSTVDSGNAEPNILFRGTHSANQGDERIPLKLPVELHVSNLSKCVEVVADEPITVETMPFNIGYGMYGSGYNPYYGGGYGGYGGLSGYGGYSSVPGGGGYSSVPGGGGYSSVPGGGGYLGGSQYPYPSYSSPYYTNYFDTSQDNAWRFGLGENKFLVKSSCSWAVEIDLDVPSELRVDGEQFELAPNTDKTVTVESGYRMGKYEVEVFARRKGSEDKKQKIETVDVVVRRAGEIDQECIELSSTKIKLNDFIGKPVKQKIYNYCYDIGVKLPREGNVIQFSCQVAGQPMNTYRFEEGQEEAMSFQPLYGNTDPFQQPSYYYNQGPTTYTGQTYMPNTNLGSGYVQGNLATQGYYYPQGAYPYGGYGSAYPSTYGFGSNCELIDSVFVTNAYTSGDPEGKTIEAVEYEVKPAINYRKMLCQYMGRMPFQTIFGLRVMLSQAYYRVEVDAAANVRYYNPFGGASNKYFQVTIEDLWGIGDTVDECMYQAGVGGVPLEKMLKCQEKGTVANIDALVNKNALDLTTKGYVKNFVPQELFNGDTFIYRTEPDVINIPPGGSADGIKSITPSTLTDTSGVSISLKPVKVDCPLPYQSGNWGIQMTVDRSGMPDNVGCAMIEKQVKLTIERPQFWDGPKEVIVPVKVNVLNKNADVATTDPEKCTGTGPRPQIPVTECAGGGESGDAIYYKYGFDRLAFDWTWEGIKKDACDYQGDSKEKGLKGQEKGMFCDAVQFSMELTQKAALLKEFVDGIATADLQKNEAIACEAMIGIKEITPGDKTTCVSQQSLRDSEGLYRLVKRQIDVQENGGSECADPNECKTVFFLKADNEILESQSTKSIKDALSGLEKYSSVTEENMYAIVENAYEKFNKITGKVDERRIVAVIKNDYATIAANKEMVDLIGIDKPTTTTGTEFDRHVMTFREYRSLHEKLWKALKGEIGTDKCYKDENPATQAIEKKEIVYANEEERKLAVVCTIGSKDVTAASLQALVNGIEKFVVGVVHTKDSEMKDGWRHIMHEAADIEGLKLPSGYTFETFYDEFVDFNAFLMKDGYTDDMISDFAANSDYTAKAAAVSFASGAWSFKYKDTADKGLPESGLFMVLLNYKFGAQKQWSVEINPDKDLEEIDTHLGVGTKYGENIFLSMPFDGDAGSANGREGYGTDFSEVKGSASIAYNEAGFGEERITKFVEAKNATQAEYGFSYGNTFAQTNTGTILKVAGTTFSYSPSNIARAQISLSPRPDSGFEGLLYNLQPSPADSTVASSQSWFIVQPAGQDAFRDSVLSQQQASTLCRQDTTAGNFRGFSEEISGLKKYTAVAYVPLESKDYVLEPICTQGQVTMKGLGSGTITMPAGHRPAGSTAYNMGLISSLQDKQRTLAYFIERIKGNTVCFDSLFGGGAELKWNTEEILK